MGEMSNIPCIDLAIARSLGELESLSFRDVDSLKKRIEVELENNFERLRDEHADMDSPLVINGFPRDDIDILQVRLIRRNVNILRNDLRRVLERSHELIGQHFEGLQAKTRKVMPTAMNVEYRIPFAMIIAVIPDSPSAMAGLQINDKVVAIGHIHAGNHMKLNNLQSLVLQNEDKQLPVKIIRNGTTMQSILTPSRQWTGKGLLGCRFVEL